MDGCYSRRSPRGWSAQPGGEERLGPWASGPLIDGTAPEISESNTRLQPCARRRERLILRWPLALSYAGLRRAAKPGSGFRDRSGAG